MGTARPAETTNSGNLTCGDDGASTLTSWPRARITWASCKTCDCTPPGTSNEYGHTIPIRIRLALGPRVAALLPAGSPIGSAVPGTDPPAIGAEACASRRDARRCCAQKRRLALA